MRENGGTFGGIGDVTRNIAAGDCRACSSQLFVSPGVIGMKMRVDDIADRSVRYGFRKLLDRGKNLIRHFGPAGVHQQHSIVADLHRDVTCCADEHVDVSLHMQQVNLGILPGVNGTCRYRGDQDGVKQFSHAKSAYY